MIAPEVGQCETIELREALARATAEKHEIANELRLRNAALDAATSVNAAHAIQDSGKDVRTGCIAITTRATAKWAEVAVADNGCGIAPENLEKIFDPFFTTKAVGRGTGQGLAIARSIVKDKHGGQLDVHTNPGVGTRFVVRLPIHGRATGESA